MERVAFVVDDTGERIDCLLNPETFEVKRLAGIRTPAAGDGRRQILGTRNQIPVNSAALNPQPEDA